MSERSAALHVAVRVLIVSPRVGSDADDSDDWIAALRELGGSTELELAHDVVTGRAALASGAGIGCWVVDEALGSELLPWIESACSAAAPPCVVVVRGGGDAFALAAFRRGAASCVVADGALVHELPAAVRTQVARRIAEAGAVRVNRTSPPASALEKSTADIIRIMNSALWVVSRDGHIDFANPTAASIVGMPTEELIGLPTSHFLRVGERWEGPIQRTLDHGERVRGAETVLTRDDGQVVPIGLSCAPLEEAGECVGAVVIFQDLTEIKQLEQQVLQTEKMASIGQLAAGVAHEINNPMGFIHANLCQLTEYAGDLGRVWEKVDTLRKIARAPGRDPAELRQAAAELEAVIDEVDAAFLLDDLAKAIQESLEGSERIHSIVQDLRAFSHQDTAKRALTDVNKALDSTANIVWTMMKHSVRLTKEYGELPPVSCYPVPLKQVFMNLIVNAYQAIEERAELDAAHRGEIRLRTELADDGVRIVITDNGVGIPDDAVARIFDPFFTTKEVGVGTGLGLSTSFNLIERHGGTLRVESEPGQGSSFEVWLPREELDARAIPS